MYGLISATFNQNPFYSVGGEVLVLSNPEHAEWHWQPSPAWLPSYILCKVPKNGFGIRHTKSGYMFRSQSDRMIYFTAAAFLGAALAAIAVIIIRKLYTTRPK